MTPDTKVSTRDINAEKDRLLSAAVLQNCPDGKRAPLNKLFTMMFRGFVYPQIWEDPEVDIEALNIDKNSCIMTIASGGCNIMNYLTEQPARVVAIDLNPAHVALSRLKIAAAKHLPDYESFFAFFGHAKDQRNVENYDRYIAPHLDAFSRNYWEGRSLIHGRRINYFTKNLYQFGLLGRTISFVHLISKIYGVDPSEILSAKTMEEQKEIFDRTLGPLFDKKAVRFACNLPVSLYGLGIPPSQFDELKGDAHMADVLRARLHRLACEFPIQDNYFAWQAFGKGYDLENKKAIPRYLSELNYNKLKSVIDNVEVHHSLLTEFLQSQPESSFDCYVFLDAQDWMTRSQLNALWLEVMRTAAPNARVIFRTAGETSPLTQKLTPDLLARWDYDPALSPKAVAKDRSSIYGGFHVYTLKP